MKDIYSLALHSSCTLFIDNTFDRSEYFITTISYKNTKIFRKSNKKIPIFHGLFLLHTSSKTEVFQQFFQHLKNLLSSVADVKGDSDAWKSNLFFVTDQEKAITSAIDKVFSNSQRILCSRHINENIKFKLESKVLKNIFKKLMECKTYDSFLEIRDSIVTNTNYINSHDKVKGYV